MSIEAGIIEIVANMFTGSKPEPDKSSALPLKEAPATNGAVNSKAIYSNSYYNTAFGGGAKFSGGLSGQYMGHVLNHALILRNARNMMHDSPEARSIVDRFADLQADIGIRLESAPIASILGINEEFARAWAQDIEQRFHLYCMDKKQHRSEDMSLYQFQRFYAFAQQRDNDMFTRLHYNNDSGLQSPLQFEAIDPTQVRGSSFTYTSFPANLTVKDGVIRDDRKRAMGYVIYVTQSDGTIKEVTIPAMDKERNRRFMLHGFQPEYAGQVRGYSRLAHVIQEFQKLTDFKLAHVQKAINEASLFMATQNKDRAPSNPLEGLILSQQAGPASLQFGSDPTPSPDAQNVTPESREPLSYCNLPSGPLIKPGLGIFTANQGDEIKLFDGKTPSAQYDTFVNAYTASLSASVGMPIEVLLMKFNQNYSASRATLILLWRTLEMFRMEMAYDLMNPIFEMWLSEEIAAGRVQAPGWSDPRLRMAWLNNSWIGSPMPDIDPSRTAKAKKEQLSLGITNAERESRGQNGSSFEDNRMKLTEQYGEPPPPPWQKPGSGGSATDVEALLSGFLIDIENMFEEHSGG